MFFFKWKCDWKFCILSYFCWNNAIFVISYNTYSIMNAYRAHHSVYSSHWAFSGYQACSTVKQFKPWRTVVTKWLCSSGVVTEQTSSSAVFTKQTMFTKPSVGFYVYRVSKVNGGCSVYLVSKVNEGFSVYQVRKVKEIFSAYQVNQGNRRS